MVHFKFWGEYHVLRTNTEKINRIQKKLEFNFILVIVMIYVKINCLQGLSRNFSLSGQNFDCQLLWASKKGVLTIVLLKKCVEGDINWVKK